MATLALTLVCAACIVVAFVADPGGPTNWRVAIPALFVGAAVSGVAGFAFSAVALALAGWCFPDPVAMVGTFLVCSIAIQVYSVAWLCQDIDSKALAPFVLGGLVGTPLGTLLLLHLDAARLAPGPAPWVASPQAWRPSRARCSYRCSGCAAGARRGSARPSSPTSS
jgi:hypothetical protein